MQYSGSIYIDLYSDRLRGRHDHIGRVSVDFSGGDESWTVEGVDAEFQTFEEAVALAAKRVKEWADNHPA